MKNFIDLVKKIILFCLIILLICGAFIFYKEKNAPNRKELDNLFHTNFESIGMYFGKNEYRLLDDDVYCLKGNVSNEINWQGIILFSKSKNINPYHNISNNYDKIFDEIFVCNHVTIYVDVFDSLDKNDEYYIPRFVLSFNTEYGYYGIFLFPNTDDYYAYTDTKIKKEDLLTIKKILNDYILIDN